MRAGLQELWRGRVVKMVGGGVLVAAGGRYKMVVLLEQHGLIYHSPGVRRRSLGCEF